MHCPCKLELVGKSVSSRIQGKVVALTFGKSNLPPLLTKVSICPICLSRINVCPFLIQQDAKENQKEVNNLIHPMTQSHLCFLFPNSKDKLIFSLALAFMNSNLITKIWTSCERIQSHIGNMIFT